jgi:predicted porin
MKKNLIALAVSAAMVAPVAVMADATVYGIGQVELTQYDPQASGSDSTTDVHDNHGMGRVGVKASEDLGNGLTAIAGFEFKADSSDNNTDKVSCTSSLTLDETVNDIDYNGDGDTTDKAVKIEDSVDNDVTLGCSGSGSASLVGRDAYVGLKGGFGTVMAGRLKSPYKYAGGVKYDAFVATALEARGNGGMTKGDYGHSGFLSNMLGYSNKFGAINVDAVYSPETDSEAMALSAMYSEGAIEAFVALVDASLTDAASDDYSATKFGGKFSTGPHSIMLQYEDTDKNSYAATLLFLGYQMKMGMNTLVFQYGMNDEDTDTKDSTYMVLGAYHNFSKTSSLFGGYRNTDVDNESGQTAISVGLRQKF